MAYYLFAVAAGAMLPFHGSGVALLTVDHVGLVGFQENPVTPGRLLGIPLAALGAVLVRVL